MVSIRSIPSTPSSLTHLDLQWIIKHREDRCTLCGQCTSVCPKEAIYLTYRRQRMPKLDILKKKRIKLDQFKVCVRGKRADDHPKIYTEIEIEYLLWAEELSTKAVEQAIELSEEKYCSASAMMSKSAEMRSSYRILAPGEKA